MADVKSVVSGKKHEKLLLRLEIGLKEWTYLLANLNTIRCILICSLGCRTGKDYVITSNSLYASKNTQTYNRQILKLSAFIAYSFIKSI